MITVECPSCKGEIEMAESDLQELAGQVIDCPGCNAKVQLPSAEAQPSETQAEHRTPEPQPIGKTCSSCGLELPANAKFCLSCGVKVGASNGVQEKGLAKTTPVTTKPASVGSQQRPDIDRGNSGLRLKRDVPIDQRNKCIGCGTALDANAVLCVACGMNQRTGKPVETSVKTGQKKTMLSSKGRRVSLGNKPISGIGGTKSVVTQPALSQTPPATDFTYLKIFVGIIVVCLVFSGVCYFQQGSSTKGGSPTVNKSAQSAHAPTEADGMRVAENFRNGIRQGQPDGITYWKTADYLYMLNGARKALPRSEWEGFLQDFAKHEQAYLITMRLRGSIDSESDVNSMIRRMATFQEALDHDINSYFLERLEAVMNEMYRQGWRGSTGD